MPKLLINRINIVLSVLAAFTWLLVPVAPAAAAPSVQISLGETAETGWEIGPMVPGDRGEQKVNIKNTGARTARLNVWLSNIAGVEGTPAEFVESAPPPGGNLAASLLLDLSADRLASSFTLPAAVDRFPTKYSTTHYLSVTRVAAGQTAVLTWRWQLPAEVGNEVQGDSLSFAISYSLVEFPAPSSGGGGGGDIIPPTPAPTAIASPAVTPVITPSRAATTAPPAAPATELRLELSLPGASSSAAVSSDGVLTETLSAISSDQVFSLTIDKGTGVSISNEGRPDSVPLEKIGANVPSRISVEMSEDAGGLALPEGWTRVSPFFDINGVTNGYTHGVQMDRPAHMVILYNDALLPENVDGLATFYYSYQFGWTQLQPPEGITAEAGQTAAETDHFSLFTVLAKTGAGPKPPARFEVNKLTLSPDRITIDQSSDVTVRVTNKGGMPGDYIVVVKVNGKTHKTQPVSLGPGESRELHLILSPGAIGVYTVEAAGASASLTVEPQAQPDVRETSYWWLLFVAIGCALLILAIFPRKRRKPEDNTN